MLLSLDVQDFAIIEDIHIDFQKGMTVLTGETGAGKSLIIDTISLLLGQRADSDMIRYGKKKAVIIGRFDYQNKKIDELLNRFNISVEPILTIERQISANGNNVVKLNGIGIPLTLLKQVASALANIHTQGDTFKLFDPDTYLDFITPVSDSKFEKLYNQYTIAYASYLDALNQYERVLKGQKESQEKIEFLQYEQQELASYQLYTGMDEELKGEISKLENFDKIYSNLTSAYEKINNDYFSIDQIYEASNHLKKISNLDEDYEKNYQLLSDSYYQLEEALDRISKQINGLDFNQEELNLKIESYQNLEKLKNKYHKTIDELISYLDDITLQIDMIEHYDEVLKRNYDYLKNAFKAVSSAATALSDYRKSYAKKIEEGILKECQELDLEHTKFEIVFEDIQIKDPLDKHIFTETGIDRVNLCISFNEGEPLKPLHKVASGGEMSRIMLAFKSFFAKHSTLSLMVFDEIDTGVSGSTAKKIAIKLHSIAQFTQVLCITHLPQVASIGDTHIHIYKEVNDNRTTTHFKYLNLKERIEEVAMMLSGDKMSLYALEHAKSLLEIKE